MKNARKDEPQSFQLSRGPSDLWIFVGVLAFGVVLIIAPAAVPWVIRVVIVAAAVVLWLLIRSVRRLVVAGAWTPASKSILGTIFSLSVLGFWIWLLARGFLGGEWLDATLASILVAEVTYLEWLKHRRG